MNGMEVIAVHRRMKKQTGIKRKVKVLIGYLILFGMKVIPAVCAGWLVSLWAIPAAYQQRGYEAIGGEWALILFVSGMVYWGVSACLDHRLTAMSQKGK